MKGLHRRIRFYGPGIVAVGAAALLLLVGPSVVTRLSRARSAMRVKHAREELADSEVLTQVNRSMQNIAQAVEPSVVHITVAATNALIPLSTGSGWVYDDDGHIITNHHVLADRRGDLKNGKIEVQFHDGARVQADLIGSDEATDVAVLQISGYPTVPAVRPQKSDVEQGDLVFAFGSPFGFQFSMSSGIVSGKGRFDRLSISRGSYQSFIQTDAAINPGNSGGPLVNSKGEVIGMNFAIAVDPDDRRSVGLTQYINSGVGLAIPLDIVEFVADQIIETGKVRRGGLGVSLVDLTIEFQDVLNYHASGVRLESVLPGSPAEAAGLRRNDIIASVDGQPVRNRESFRALAHAKSPDEQVVLGIWRDGERLSIAVILSEWNDATNSTILMSDSPLHSVVRFDSLGVVLVRLNSEQLARLRFDSTIKSGVYVQAMQVDAPGFDLGLRCGTVIVSAGGHSVSDPSEFASLLKDESIQRSGIDLEVVDIEGEHRVLRLLVPADQTDEDNASRN